MSVKSALIQLLKTHQIDFSEKEILSFDGFEYLYIDDKKLIFLFINPQNFEIIQQNQSLINEYAKRNQLRLIQLSEKEWNEMPELIQNRILSLFKIRKRIHARTCKVKVLDKSDSDTFLLNHHSMGKTGAPYRLGLTYDDQLVAVAVFSKAKVMTYEEIPYYSYVWERFASTSDSTVVGGMSKLLQAFIKNTGAKHIMTYADANWGNGDAYLKMGFKEIKKLDFDLLTEQANPKEKSFSSIKYILDLR